MEEASHLFANEPDVELVDDPYDAAEQADALVVVTEWKMFRALDVDQLKQKMRQFVIVDGRNIYDPMTLGDAGFKYYSIGRA